MVSLRTIRGKNTILTANGGKLMSDFDFPYTMVTGKLKEVLSKIREVGVPQKATQQWLASLGFKSTNDRSILSVLKFVRFIDESSTPTELWKQYRGANYKKVLADGIKQGYSDLFSMYSDAHNRSTDLEHFFSTKTSAGKEVMERMIQTFKALCEIAEFNGAPEVIAPAVGSTLEEPSSSQETKGFPGTTKIVTQGFGSGVTININIQLSVPDTSDETVYDKFFAALKKHLLS